MSLEMRLRIQDHIRTKIPLGQEFTAREVAVSLAEEYRYGPTANDVASAIRMMADVEFIPTTKRNTNGPTVYKRVKL